MNNTSTQPSTDTIAVPKPSFPPLFYRIQYRRMICIILFLLVVEFVLLVVSVFMMYSQANPNVYAATLEGKLFPLQEVRPIS